MKFSVESRLGESSIIWLGTAHPVTSCCWIFERQSVQLVAAWLSILHTGPSSSLDISPPEPLSIKKKGWFCPCQFHIYGAPSLETVNAHFIIGHQPTWASVHRAGGLILRGRERIQRGRPNQSPANNILINIMTNIQPYIIYIIA